MSSFYHCIIILLGLFINWRTGSCYETSTDNVDCAVSVDSDGQCTAPNTLCETEKWISQNGTVPGYHVLCITPNGNALDIEFYRDGVNMPAHSGRYTSDAKTFAKLRIELEKVLHIKWTDKLRDDTPHELDKHNPWAAFNPRGIRIRDIDLMRGTIVLFEG